MQDRMVFLVTAIAAILLFVFLAIRGTLQMRRLFREIPKSTGKIVWAILLYGILLLIFGNVIFNSLSYVLS